MYRGSLAWLLYLAVAILGWHTLHQSSNPLSFVIKNRSRSHDVDLSDLFAALQAREAQQSLHAAISSSDSDCDSRIGVSFGSNDTSIFDNLTSPEIKRNGHSKRELTPEQQAARQARFAAAVCKGAILQWLMRLTRQQAYEGGNPYLAYAQDSPWSTFEQASPQGWRLDHRGELQSFRHPAAGMFERLGLTFEGNVNYIFEHRETGGEYWYAMRAQNPSWMVALDLKSPRTTASDASDVPTLYRASDASFLLWQWVANTTPERGGTAPRYFMHRYITNAATLEIMAYISGGDDVHAIPELPGAIYFTPDMDQFKAMLATPNGKGICWFLIQHKWYFGRMDIQGIWVWKDGLDDSKFAFVIGPATQDVGTQMGG